MDGLADLTGGVAECLPLRGDPTGSGRLLVELLDMTSVITANIQVIVVVVVDVVVVVVVVGVVVVVVVVGSPPRGPYWLRQAAC